MFCRCSTLETLKTIRYFRNIHIKIPNKLVNEKTRLSEELAKRRCDMLCETLNCNIHTAREIVAKNKEVIHFDDNLFSQNARFIKNYLKLSDLIEYPCLLTLQPSLLQHRYFSLKELGFCNVSPNYILR